MDPFDIILHTKKKEKKKFKYLRAGICPTSVVLHGLRVFIISFAQLLTAASSVGFGVGVLRLVALDLK